MKFTAKQIADYLGGAVDGNPNIEVDNFSKIEEGKPGTLSFFANPKYEQYIYDTKASIIIVNNDFIPSKRLKLTLIRVENAYDSFAQLLELYQSQIESSKIGIDKLSFIDTSAKLGTDVYISAFAYVGKNVTIGNNVKIYPHVFLGDNVIIGENTTINAGVKIYHDCIIGDNCILHAGVVIGADGFGFAPQTNKAFKKVAQIGNVVIHNGVEIGANTTIDRATMGSTIIEKNVKLDNQIQIAHNVVVGENTVIAAHTGVSGSTKIGKNCMIAGQVGFAGHLIIEDHVIIGAQAGVSKSVCSGKILQGTPAFELKNFQRSNVVIQKLPELYKEVYSLEKKVDELTKLLQNERR